MLSLRPSPPTQLSERNLFVNFLNTKKKSKGSPISKIIRNNKEITDDKDIANALNDHFTKIGKNLADKVKPERNDLFKNYLTNPINESFSRPTDNNEALKESNNRYQSIITETRKTRSN